MRYSRAVQHLGDRMAVLEHFCGPALLLLTPVSTEAGRARGLSMHRGCRRPWAMALPLGTPVLLAASLLTLLID